MATPPSVRESVSVPESLLIVSLRCCAAVPLGAFARAMTDAPQLKLFNSLNRQLEPFVPVHEGEARVYTCGPTVYNYPHIGNMRA